MSQHDYDIANADGATVRADINALVEAIASNNSGATAPGTTFAYMWWIDTANNLVKQRNGANTDWITRGDLTSLYFGAEPADAAILKSDTTANLTAGFTGTHDLGNTGTSSITPTFATGNDKKATVTGDFTLNDPTTGEGWMVITFTNDGAGPHSPTFDGFALTLLPNSADWDDTDAAENQVLIRRKGTESRYGIYNG